MKRVCVREGEGNSTFLERISVAVVIDGPVWLLMGVIVCLSCHRANWM